MQHHVTSSLSACLSENGFSLDELVCRMKELFEKKAFPELLGQILQLAEENLRLRIMGGMESPVKCECGCGRLSLNGAQGRRLATTLGEISLPRTSRVKCRQCGKTFGLLARFLGVVAYQTKTNELEKRVLEAVAGDSYRRANKAVRAMTGVTAGHTTFHNWVLRSAADEISVPEGVIGSVPGQLVADATKYRSADGGGTGDIKVMLGVNGRGETFPIGTWTRRETWAEISEEIERRKLVFPEGTILVSDGERGLAEALSRHVSDAQRCHWHIVRDTYHAMWQDGGTAEEARPVQEALRAVLAIELPEGEFQKVPEGEKDEIERRTEEAEAVVDKLIAHLRGRGFGKVAEYLRRSRDYMFSYVRRWLRLGIACPRASSLIERTMREIARRVKRLAHNWKAEGLGKVVRIVLKLFTQPGEWEKYWRERMNLTQTVLLSFRIIKDKSPSL